MENALLAKHHRDQSRRSADQLLSDHYPLIRSVCRRYLRRQQDVEDAVQETFVKLMRHAGDIQGDVRGWLATAASSTCIDMIRRATSEQRRRNHWGQMAPAMFQHQLVQEAIRLRLHEAMLHLTDASRVLIVDRFIKKMPLRVIAGRQNTSVASVSRSAGRALSELTVILRDMGVRGADDFSVIEHFGSTPGIPECTSASEDGLCFASDWPALAEPVRRGVDSGSEFLPGWSRPIRVGAFMSFRTTQVIDHGKPCDEIQLLTVRHICHSAIQWVGIVEPATTHQPVIERTLRDYDLTAGLVDATDIEGLRTLDVILLGFNLLMDPEVAGALLGAVQSGVGLLNEYCTGAQSGPSLETRELMLADSPMHYYCTSCRPGEICGTWLPATVHESHPILPGFYPGMKFLSRGCGPVFRPKPGAQVLCSKDHVIMPEQHRIPGLGPTRQPQYIVGQIGRGRVVVINEINHLVIANSPVMSRSYFLDLLAWLGQTGRAD